MAPLRTDLHDIQQRSQDYLQVKKQVTRKQIEAALDQAKLMLLPFR